MSGGRRRIDRAVPGFRSSARRRLLLALAAMAALICQNAFAQAHVHVDRQAVAASRTVAASTGHGPAADHAPSEDPADCPICHELAQAGHCLIPAPIAVRAAPVLSVWYPRPVVRGRPRAARRDASQIRGPPAPFSA